MQIDIRNGNAEEITEIVFHGPDCNKDDAVKIYLAGRFTSIDSADGLVRCILIPRNTLRTSSKLLKKPSN